ncbi:hypothetical protein V1504DRAFT_430055 [Lipomyces starkeyi]
MSTSITRFLLTFEDDYGDDLSTLIDESVDLGDVGESHMKTVAGTLAGYVKDVWKPTYCFRVQGSVGVLAAALTEDGSLLPATSAAVRKTMKPFVSAVAFLDLACARRGNDGDDARFWNGASYQDTGRRNKTRRGGPSLPVGQNAYTGQAFCDRYISPFRGQFGSLREKTPEAWLAGKSTVNAEIKFVARRVGFMLEGLRHPKQTSTSYDDKMLLRTMVIGKCITTPDRFTHWRILFDDRTWNAVEALFVELQQRL